MEPTVEELRKNYDRFDDEKIKRLATEEAGNLRPEALELLKQIIKERGLSIQPEVIKVQLKEPSQTEFNNYTEIIRKIPCPICNSDGQKLNATITGTVMSFILMTSYQKSLKIACPDCLDKENNDAIIKSVLLGWWGFPWGIIRTIQSIILNNKMKEHNHDPEPNALLNAFVHQRMGRIEANKNNSEELVSMIKHIR